MTWRSWLVPPGLTQWVALRRGELIKFDDRYGSWDGAESHGSGYDSAEILDRVEAATHKVLRGEATYERDSIVFDAPEYRWPVLACLLNVAAHDGQLRVLDFGGSLGSVYWQHRDFLRTLDVTWGVVEQSDFVARGRSLDQSEVQFFETIQESLEVFNPNVILLSSVLQYLPDPGRILHELLSTTAQTVIVDRTPTSLSSENIACLQIVPSSIYPASYPAWVFSKDWIRKQLTGWQITAEFEGIESRSLTSQGVEFGWDGFCASRGTHG